MKLLEKLETKTFKVLTVTLTLETEGEVEELYARLNAPHSRIRDYGYNGRKPETCHIDAKDACAVLDYLVEKGGLHNG